jgi:hypothetical protein
MDVRWILFGWGERTRGLKDEPGARSRRMKIDGDELIMMKPVEMAVMNEYDTLQVGE